MDTTGPAQIAEAAKHEDERRKDDADDLRWIMSTQQGRRFLGNLIYDPEKMLGGGVGVTQSVFSQSHASMSAREGARDLALRLLACCEAIDFDLAQSIRKERHFEAQALAIQMTQKRVTDAEPEWPIMDGPAA